MIIDVLLDITNTLIGWAISIRPTWELHLPPSVADLIQRIWQYDNYLPVTEVMTLLSLGVTLVTALMAWKLTVKLVDWITAVIP